MGVFNTLRDSTSGIFNLDSRNKSRLLRGILLSTAGIAVIAALSIVITGQNRSSLYVTSSNNNELLKLSPSGNVGNLDLTILGDFDPRGNILKAPAPGENEEDQQENGEKGAAENPIVRISRQGRVQGAILKSRQNREYYAFYQVPYGRPPVGKLRFALPKDVRRWRGVRDGSVPGPSCMQREKYAKEPNITAGREDCLNVNIYTPKLPASRRDAVGLPVLVYIHGGGPNGNGTRYGAQYMMDEDVVLVTVEFRLGMFGGFTTGTKEFPGNVGYRDQVAALKWVQKNIDRFGGDPERVLLVGHSSGGGNVQAHLLSPMSQGLFQRAIVMSGSCLQVAMVKQDPLEIVRDFSLEVGCGDFGQNDTVEETTECLRGLSAETIALSSGQLAISGIMSEDHEDDVDQKFLPQLPWTLLQEGRVSSHVPILIGVTSNEMFHSGGVTTEMLLRNDTVKELNDNFYDYLPDMVGLEDDADQTMAKKFRQLYFGSKEISNATRLQLWDITSDKFVHSVRISGLAHANITSQPTYFYWLSKEPAFSYAESTKKMFPPPYGVAHADELQFLFPYYGYPEYPVGSPWFDFSQKLVKIWVSFARNERPDIKGQGVDFEWEPISLEDNGMKYLQLDDEIKYVQPFTQRMELWDEYTQQLYS